MPRAKKPRVDRRGDPTPRTPLKWIRTASDRAAVEAGCYFDQDAADHVCFFFETFLTHSKGAFGSRPFLLESWQRDYLSQLFGWKRADGTRRFRESYLEVPKKNGKSTLLSGICLFGLFDEMGAEVYTGAVDRSQASIILDECGNMAEASPDLAEVLQVVRSKKSIFFHGTRSKLVAMSADAPSKDGVNSSTTVLDEVHRFKDSALYDVMKFAGAARSQPLLISITTAGHDRHSLCYRLHQRAKAVLDGSKVDIGFLPVIYAADPADDPHDVKTWIKANPSMGAVLKLEDFREAYEEAKQIPRLWNLFLRLRLNIWTEAETRWLDPQKWAALGEKISRASLKGRKCFVGLDLSSTRDLTCLCFVFPFPLVGEWSYRVIPFFFVPRETLDERERNDKVPYRDWAGSKHLIVTPGSSTDYTAIRKLLNDFRAEFEIVKVGIDPWNAQQLNNDLVEDGFDVVGIRQQYAQLSPGSKELERLILRDKIRHNGNPAMNWCIANCAVKEDSRGNIMPCKKKSTERIDGVVALVNGLYLASAEPPPPEKPGASFL